MDQVARRLIPDEVASVWTDPTGGINLVEYPLPEARAAAPWPSWCDADRYRPVMITRGGQARLVSPGLVGQEGDIVHFAVRTDAIVPADQKPPRRGGRAGTGSGPVKVSIAGGGVVGRSIAQRPGSQRP